MGSTRGFGYRYRFWIDEEILADYNHNSWPWMLKPSPDIKTFLFEIRTNFILKTRRDEKIMDSERYGGWAQELGSTGRFLEDYIAFRLHDYWMSDDEAQRLINDAHDFAQHNWSQLYGHDSTDDNLPFVIPVVVGLDVCTVQQEGEAIEAATDRAIMAERMIPLRLFPVGQDRNGSIAKREGTQNPNWLLGLQRSRVEYVSDIVVDDQCSICLQQPTIGAQISRLISCGHVFHTHCIVPWLERKLECPLCRTKLGFVVS